MQWSTDLQKMDWWIERLRPFTSHTVGSIVPSGFEAVGRLFHPIEKSEHETETWTAVAERFARISHPEMQLHAISTPLGRTPVFDHNSDELHCWTGDLNAVETVLLRDIVARHTDTPDRCCFGVWDGYGMLHGGSRVSTFFRTGPTPSPPPEPTPGRLPAEVIKAGPAGKPSRQYYLLEGALAAMDMARKLLGQQTPNLWWPDDRSWFVATEIDFCWTLIGGSRELMDELTIAEGLEVLQSGYDHRGTVDADKLNT